MTTVPSSLFETTILVQSDARSNLAATTPTTVRRSTRPTPQMPASLWRHTQNEAASETRHQQTTGRLLAGATLLGGGSVVYALTHVWTLLSGNRLHDTVAAFLQ